MTRKHALCQLLLDLYDEMPGLTWEPTRGGHIKITRPGFPGCVHVARTPSDHRAFKNITAQVRRTLGGEEPNDRPDS
jgi:hypothetical protein